MRPVRVCFDIPSGLVQGIERVEKSSSAADVSREAILLADIILIQALHNLRHASELAKADCRIADGTLRTSPACLQALSILTLGM